jgi:hypothetical protein
VEGSEKNKEGTNLSDLPALVVTAQKGHAGRMTRLQQHQHGEHLQAVVPAVHKVPHKDIVCGGDLATGVKETEKIMELAVDVAAYLPTRSGHHMHHAPSRESLYLMPAHQSKYSP